MAINNNVEKRLEGKGDLAVKEGLMKLAEKDKADLQFDLSWTL